MHASASVPRATRAAHRNARARCLLHCLTQAHIFPGFVHHQVGTSWREPRHSIENEKNYLRVRHGGGRARKCYRMSFETPFSEASHLRKGSERLTGLSGRHSPQFFPAFGLPPPCDQKIRFRPRAGRNRIRVACGAGRELPTGVRPGPDHRTRTVHTGMPARWGAPVVHAHAASRARETRVWVRWPHHVPRAHGLHHKPETRSPNKQKEKKKREF